MSQVRSDVDLSALARPTTSVEPPKRSKLRILVPLALLLGFAALLASTLTDLFRDVHSITVVRPTAPNADQVAALGEDTVVVQASGWIEPDPFPIHVAALAEGVVEEVLVQESDLVEVDQIVARLVDEDARIARDSAEAELAIRQAEEAEARARSTIAQERLDAGIEVTEAIDAARAALSGAKAASALRAAAVVEGEAKLALAEEELVVQQELEAAGASGVRQVEIAAAAIQEATGRLAGLQAEAALAAATIAERQARLTRAEKDLELRFDDRLEVELAQAQVDHAKAEVRKATATLEAAQLRLDRMVIRSPREGIVLERLALPGMVLTAQGQANAVCSLYEPSSLRVRVDVPQPQVERIFAGQRALIDAESRRGRPYEGEVLRVVQQANLAKVTLEVQVRVKDGDALLRPEMLAQVRFFGAAGGGESGVESTDEVVLVPRRLVRDDHVWVMAGGEATRRAIETGATHGELIEVRRGLNLTDKLIDGGREGLAEGDRVAIEGDAR